MSLVCWLPALLAALYLSPDSTRNLAYLIGLLKDGVPLLARPQYEACREQPWLVRARDALRRASLQIRITEKPPGGTPTPNQPSPDISPVEPNCWCPPKSNFATVSPPLRALKMCRKTKDRFPVGRWGSATRPFSIEPITVRRNSCDVQPGPAEDTPDH